MALVSTSQVVTDQSASPVVKTNQLEKGGLVRTAQGFLAAANFTGGTAGQWYTFVRIPARARVLGIYATKASTTAGSVKVGLYRPDGIAIDDDVFATAFDMGAEHDRAAMMVTPTASQRQSALKDAYSTAVGTAGATGDAEYDIALTIVTALTGAVDTLIEVDYVLPE